MISHNFNTILILQLLFANLTLCFDWPWNKCGSKTLNNHTCALLFENENCREHGFAIFVSRGKRTTLPIELHSIKSIIVKAGCTLGAYSDRKCRGDFYPFRAIFDQDLIVKEDVFETSMYLRVLLRL